MECFPRLVKIKIVMVTITIKVTTFVSIYYRIRFQIHSFEIIKTFLKVNRNIRHAKDGYFLTQGPNPSRNIKNKADYSQLNHTIEHMKLLSIDIAPLSSH